MKAKPINVILLGATPSVGLQVIHCLARTQRYRVVAATTELPHLLQFSSHCRHVHLANWNWDQGPNQLHQALPDEQGAILIPILPAAIRWTIRHRKSLEIRWMPSGLPSALAFETAFDKVAALASARRLGLDTPDFLRLESSSDAQLDPVLAQFGFPLLIKPTWGTGGDEIVLVRNPEELRQRIRDLRNPSRFHLERFLPGSDISCGVLFHQGQFQTAVAYQGLTRRKPFGPFRSIRTIHAPEVIRFASTYLHSLAWDGPANLDFRQTADGRIFLLDVNPRCWGNIRSLLVAGINFPDLICQLTLGNNPPVPQASIASYLSPIDSLVRIARLLRHPCTASTRVGNWRDSSLRHVLSDPKVYWSMFRQPMRIAGGGVRHLRWLWESFHAQPDPELQPPPGNPNLPTQRSSLSPETLTPTRTTISSPINEDHPRSPR